MKVNSEYCIMRNGYYIEETDKEGLYNQVNDLSKATLFSSLETTKIYIESDLHLNLANVSIHEIRTTVEEITLVKVNNEFVDITTVEQCNSCFKWFPLNELHHYRHDLDSDREYLCEKCYEEMDNKYPNNLGGK